MSVKAYYCDQCGSPINFAGQTNAICQTCGLNNVNAEAEKAALEARALAEQFLGDIKELESRLQASGDSQARDYIFRKDILPRLEVVFDDLIERFDDYFRRPIFHFKLLKRYSQLFNVKKVFKTESSKKFSKNFTSDLNQFAMGQLNLDVIDLLASSDNSRNQIKIYKHHSMFLSRLYNIRGMTLNLDLDNLTAIQNLLDLASEDTEILKESYSKIKYGMTESVKFNAWNLRLALNHNIARILDSCFKGQYQQVVPYFDQMIDKTDELIEYFKQKNSEDEETYPLFLIMVITEGFNIDKKILLFLQKVVDTIIRGEIEADFSSVMNQIIKIIDIADQNFNDVKIKSPEWDNDWIDNLEEPFERLFEILDNLVYNRMISTGKESVYILDYDQKLFEPWLNDEIVIGKELDRIYFKTRSAFNIRNVIRLYIPLALIQTYAIMKTGFIRKGGDEFESLLLVNPYFKFDPTVNMYGYAKSFSYIDIAEDLKEKDSMKTQLDHIDDIIEDDLRDNINSNSLVLPVLVTKKEIEEYVQKTYDLFELVQDEDTPPIPNFFQLYKNIGIAKKVERLSGELIDFLYVPALMMEMAEGKIKKDSFRAKSDYEWKLLMPYNNEIKDPFNLFLKMEINPIALLNIAFESQKISNIALDMGYIPEENFDEPKIISEEVSDFQFEEESPTPKFCKSCGNELKSGDKFCRDCGFEL